MSWAGFRFTQERFADNTQFYKDCLAHPSDAAQMGLTTEQARINVDILRRFPPSKAHERVSAHEVEVYAIRDPTWYAAGKLLSPQGDLARVLSIDLGKVIRDACEEEGMFREKLGPATIDLGDGTSVVGVRTRVSRYGGPPNERIIPNEHLKIRFDPSHYAEKGEFTYILDLDRGAMTPAQPKEYRIRSYVLIDGQSVFEKMQVARPRFLPTPTGLPERFSHLVFTAN